MEHPSFIPAVSVKEQLLASFRSLPDDATWADVEEQFRLLAALDQAEKEIARGEGIPHETAKARIEACLRKLSGPQAA